MSRRSTLGFYTYCFYRKRPFSLDQSYFLLSKVNLSYMTSSFDINFRGASGAESSNVAE